MAIPKSDKLLREQAKEAALHESTSEIEPEQAETGPIKIREIPCLNDFVALMQLRVQTTGNIKLSGEGAYKNEGMVVGIGPGLVGPDGKRCPTQLKMGDVVMFVTGVVTKIEPKKGLYKDCRILIISERSLLCKLPAVPYELVSNEKHEAHD